MKKLLTFLTAGLILAGCSTTVKDESPSVSLPSQNSNAETVSSAAEATAAVTISVKVDGSEIDGNAKKIEVEEGAVLLDVMKEHYEIEEDNNFITSIDGHEQDTEEGKYWLFDINGEQAPVGADQIQLQEGDTIEWELKKI